MKTIIALALLAVPAVASAQDFCHPRRRSHHPRPVETCSPRTVTETYYVQVPYHYWLWDWCRMRWVEQCGYRTEARTRCRTIWVCGSGCQNSHHRSTCD